MPKKKPLYLNIHALEVFTNDTTDDDLCRECAYFSNLDINIDRSNEIQTESQPYLLMTGIFLSPAFWVLLALPDKYIGLMLVSAICILVATVVGICLCCYGYGLEKRDEGCMWWCNGNEEEEAELAATSPTMSMENISKTAHRFRARVTGKDHEDGEMRIHQWFKGILCTQYSLMFFITV